MPPMPLWANGVDEISGRQVRVAVGHGEHPVAALARRGWLAGAVLDARLETGSSQSSAPAARIVLRYAAAAAAPGELVAAAGGPGPVPRDPGLVVAAGERAVPVQRVTAHALVRSARGLLLTQLSELTHAAGRWTLPGGGLHPGEDPVAALRREVFEETGQRIDEPQLVDVLDAHWIGRAPDGRLEDFHAVRLLYRAACPQPSRPTVHEQGSTTAAAGWQSIEQLSDLPLSPTWAGVLRRPA